MAEKKSLAKELTKGFVAENPVLSSFSAPVPPLPLPPRFQVQ